MSSFWSLWIIILTTTCVGLVSWLLFITNRENTTGETTGHEYDGIEEYDNPMPSWWVKMFVGSIIFAIAYLVIYPGMGTYKGIFAYISSEEAYKDGWTSVGQWQIEQEAGEAQFMQQSKEYVAVPAASLVENHGALRMGRRLFKSNCSVCHGSDGKGTYAFPNLTDDVWLYGGTEENIKQTITYGRNGTMPSWGKVLGTDLDAMAVYIKSLNSADTRKDAENNPMHEKFQMLCTACHGKDAQGSQIVGAPSLTNDNWLYGGSLAEIKLTIDQGRSGVMPAHENKLSKERIHLLTAYVMSLSHVPE
ncbi:MAG: cytochrome-c oxidase, cbb3-type subunit III [Pseudomonadales bacterium]|nr:cytochrome-c oxidase, cbb3-type subunit III [Pseudomonadales bacterium]